MPSLATEHNPGHFEAGTTLFNDRYQLRKRLQEDRLSELWLAWDRSFEKEVALHFLPVAIRRDARMLDRLRRLARLGLENPHPSILKILDFLESDEGLVIAREYCPNGSLEECAFSQSERCLTTEQLNAPALQVFSALDHLHKAGFAHRDLRPSQIFIDQSGNAKLAPFGIAAALRDWYALQNPGNAVGPEIVYASPQCLMGEDPSPADDFYALGATFYELLTGQPVFYTGDIPKQIAQRQPPSLSERRKALGFAPAVIAPAWESIVAGWLDKEAAPRLETAARAPQLLLSPQGAEAPPVPAPTPKPRPKTHTAPRTTTPPPATPPRDRNPSPHPAPSAPSEKPAQKGTILGKILLLLFIVGLAGAGASKMGLIDKLDRPTPETQLVVQGQEWNVTEPTDTLSVNAFYRMKDMQATIENGSQSIPVSIRDRSFFDWGDIITVETNAWTGETTSGDQPVNYRFAVEIPKGTGLVGEQLELKVTMQAEIPVMEANEEQLTFREDLTAFAKSYPVKLLAKDRRPWTEVSLEMGIAVAIASLVLGILRLFGKGFFDSERSRKLFNGFCLLAAIGGIATFYFKQEETFHGELARVRQLAAAEEKLAQKKYSEALDLIDNVLTSDPYNIPAQELQEKIHSLPRTLSVPSQYATIADAISNAKDGDLIKLGPGVHKGPVVFGKNISLSGSGQESIIEIDASSSEAPNLKILANATVFISNVTITHVGDVESEDARPALVLCEGEGAFLNISNAFVRGAAGHGIAISEGGKAEISGCGVTASHWSGILVNGTGPDGSPSKAYVNAESTIFDNHDHGIKVRAGAELEAQEITIQGNYSCGLIVEAQSKASIQSSISIRNDAWGMIVGGEGASISYWEVVCEDNIQGDMTSVEGAQLIEE